MDVMQKIGEKIAEKRKEKGWTQRELAEKLCVSDKNVSKWECGRSVPDIFYLKRLADLFEVNVDYFLDREETDENIDENRIKRTRAGKISLILLMIAALLPLVVTVVARIFLPDTVPCHYNAEGEVTRWGSSKELVIMGSAYFAIVLIAATASYVGLVRIDNPEVKPWTVCLAFSLFCAMALAFVAIEIGIVVKNAALAAEAGYTVRESSKFAELFSVLICTLYAVCGAVCIFVPQNAFVGVRTSYSFSGKKEWAFVNAFAGVVLYGISAVMILVTGVLDYPLGVGYAIAVTIGPAVVAFGSAYIGGAIHKNLQAKKREKSE